MRFKLSTTYLSIEIKFVKIYIYKIWRVIQFNQFLLFYSLFQSRLAYASSMKYPCSILYSILSSILIMEVNFKEQKLVRDQIVARNKNCNKENHHESVSKFVMAIAM